MPLIIDDKAQTTQDVACRSFFSAVDFSVASSSAVRVAFDCEGVNLSRLGTLELVSLAFDESIVDETGSEVFLIDLSDKCDRSLRNERASALKKLFESENVVKIIHDCRMDCDALFHHHDITLANVHDTSCFHAAISHCEDKNLNDVLSYNGIAENGARDKTVYRTNPRFWAMRPLTAKMIEWASSDVDKLLQLAAKQETALQSRSETHFEKAKQQSMEFAAHARDMSVAEDLRCKVNIGRFIGTRGCNLRSLQKRTNTLIYSDRGPSGETWFVYYSDPSDLTAVKNVMGY